MKNYLIIGASSGIGKSLMEMLAKDENEIWGTFYKNELQKDLPNAHFHYINVLDESIDFSFLPDVLDGLAYCPGSINLKPFGRIKLEDFQKDYELQLLGAVKCIQLLLPRLKKSAQASIVLFSTVAVQTGFGYHSIVSSSKGAVEGLCRALAAELAPNIRVNCVAPSITDTPLAANLLGTEEKRNANAVRHPLKKIGTAQDIANLAAFLISDKSGWITGQVYQVDGGISSVR